MTESWHLRNCDLESINDFPSWTKSACESTELEISITPLFLTAILYVLADGTPESKLPSFFDSEGRMSLNEDFRGRTRRSEPARLSSVGIGADEFNDKTVGCCHGVVACLGARVGTLCIARVRCPDEAWGADLRIVICLYSPLFDKMTQFIYNLKVRSKMFKGRGSSSRMKPFCDIEFSKKA